MSGADLSGSDLSGADLRGTNLKDAKIQGANFSDTILDQTSIATLKPSYAKAYPMFSDGDGPTVVGEQDAAGKQCLADLKAEWAKNQGVARAGSERDDRRFQMLRNIPREKLMSCGATPNQSDVEEMAVYRRMSDPANVCEGCCLKNLDFRQSSFKDGLQIWQSDISDTNFSEMEIDLVIKASTGTRVDFSRAKFVNPSGRANVIKVVTGRVIGKFATFSGVELIDADFTGADLSEAVFRGVTLSGAKFIDVQLSPKTIFDTVDFSGAVFDEKTLAGVKKLLRDQEDLDLLRSALVLKEGVAVPIAQMDDPGAARQAFSRASVKRCGTCEPPCDLREQNLASLKIKNLSNADLTNADLSKADLSGANLSGANLTGANLANADLTNVDFTGGNLSGAIFDRSNIKGAVFSGATLDQKALTSLRGGPRAGYEFACADVIRMGGEFLERGGPLNIWNGCKSLAKHYDQTSGAGLRTRPGGDRELLAYFSPPTKYHKALGIVPRVVYGLTERQKSDFDDGRLFRCVLCDLRNLDFSFHRQVLNLQWSDLTGADLTDVNLSDGSFREALLVGANLSGANLNNAHLIGADLSNANLTGVDLRRANLSGANLRGANLTGVELDKETNLSSVDLTGSIFDLKTATRAKVNLTDATLPNATGTAKTKTEVAAKDGQQPVTAKEVGQRAKLSGRNLAGLKLKGEDLLQIDLSNADLTDVDLRGARLWHANLSGANLTGAKLTNANLREADLRYANLTNANLSQADMQGVKLQGANFTGAKLIKTRMGIAPASQTGGEFATNFVDVNFTNANLKGANWKGVSIVDRVDFSGANLSNTETPGSGAHKTFPSIALGVTLKNTNLSGVVLGRALCVGLGNSCVIETSLTELFKSGVGFNLTAGNKYFVVEGGLLALILKRSQLSQFGDNWNNVSTNYPDRLLEAIYFPASYDDSADDPILALNLRGAMALAEEGILKISHPYRLKSTLDFFNRSFPKQVTATRKRRKEQEQVAGKECKGCNYKSQDLRDKNFAEGDLEGSDFSGANLAGVDLWGAKLKDVKLIGADMSGADLRGAKLGGANLEGANLKCANLSQADLSQAALSGANLQGAILYKAKLRNVVADNANFVNAFIYDGDFSGKFRGAWFSGSILPAYLSGSDFSKASFKGAHFHLTAEAAQERIGSRRITAPRYNSEGDLRDSPTTLDRDWRNPRANPGPKLENLNLRGADLTGLDIRGGSLAGSNLDGAIMVGADMGTWDRSLYSWDSKVTREGYFRLPEDGLRKTTQTDLRRSSLRGADLTAARLQGAKLDNADFSDALIWRTDLELAEIEVTDFHGAIIDLKGLKPLEDFIDMGLFESMDCSAEDVRAVQQSILDLQPKFCRKIAQE